MREQAIQVSRLQENLSSIRKIAGWTAGDLGEMIGVSKQNISNLENNKIRLSQAQYIAIRHLVDYHITKTSNKVLKMSMKLLIDNTNIVGNEYNSLKNTVKNIASAAISIKGYALQLFAETLVKANFDKGSDLIGMDNLIMRVFETDEMYDWTTRIIECIHE